jgi:hypothetical protein
VSVKVESRATGIVIYVDALTVQGSWKSFLRFDVFGSRPHWHRFSSSGGEDVRPLDEADPVEQSVRILGDVAELLDDAGYARSISNTFASTPDWVQRTVREGIGRQSIGR